VNCEKNRIQIIQDVLQMKNTFQKIITYGLYPFLLVSHIVICWLAISYEWDLKKIAAYTGGPQFVLLLLIEFIFPIRQEWKMTWKSFFRDLKYFASGGLTLFLSTTAISYAAIYLSEKNVGILKQFPFLLSFVIVLLVYEFVLYWYHRLSHEMSGKVGGFLWRVHSAHHLPDKVYLLMHAVFHPLNAVAATIILQSILIIAGVDAKSLFLLNTFVSLQGLVSHFNVDLRAGFLNYIFIGTELHRFHHSTDINESKNYGQIISIWDIVFGTFYYKPGVYPERLGVAEPIEYPQSHRYWQVLTFPFRGKKAIAE
jgi:sterol desaturase/sphingolipid hydroxylase (fatty acid hydroxylase superfamily)